MTDTLWQSKNCISLIGATYNSKLTINLIKLVGCFCVHPYFIYFVKSDCTPCKENDSYLLCNLESLSPFNCYTARCRYVIYRSANISLKPRSMTLSCWTSHEHTDVESIDPTNYLHPWGIIGIVVACWAGGRHVDRSWTRYMIRNKILLISPGNLTNAVSWPKTPLPSPTFIATSYQYVLKIPWSNLQQNGYTREQMICRR